MLATPTTSERGYGVEHRRIRRAVARDVEAGRAFCARCGRFIAPGSPWHLGHDHQGGGYLGPEPERCSIADRNRRHRKRARRRSSRDW